MIWTPERIGFLKEKIRTNPAALNRELAGLLNSHFGLSFSRIQIKSAVYRFGLSKGRERNPTGTERKNSDGFIVVKVSHTGTDFEKWKFKHRLIWEQERGPIPEGHIITFADGNKYNFDLDNLVCVTKAEIIQMNYNSLRSKDAEVTKAGIAITRLNLTIHRRLYEHLGKREYRKLKKRRYKEKRFKEINNGKA